MGTHEVRRRLALRRRYKRLVEDVVQPLAHGTVDAWDRDRCAETVASATPARRLCPRTPGDLARRQAAFGCSREEIELLLKPLIADAHEAVGSMGDDTPPAVLSSRSRLLTDFFRQRFAQVTNPSVDPYRESAGDVADDAARRTGAVFRRARAAPAADRAAVADSGRAPADRAAVVARAQPDGDRAAVRRRNRRRAARREAARHRRPSVRRGRGRQRLGRPLRSRPRRGTRAGAGAAGDGRGPPRAHRPRSPSSRQHRRRHRRCARCAPARRAVRATARRRSARPSASRPSPPSPREIRPAAIGATTRYRLALERGLRTLMSKMGVCTFSGYCGAQLFEILGLDAALVARFFPGTPSPVGGATLADIAADLIRPPPPRVRARQLPAADYPGLHGYRRNGEYHATNPLVVRGLQPRRATSAITTSCSQSHVHGRPADGDSRSAGVRAEPRARAAGRGRAGRRDLPALLRVGDVGRRALAGSAPHDRARR